MKTDNGNFNNPMYATNFEKQLDCTSCPFMKVLNTDCYDADLGSGL